MKGNHLHEKFKTMTAEQQYKMLYPRSGAGHQVYEFAHPQAVANRSIRPPSLIPHAATSAFRPAGAPQVPLEQRFVSPGLAPSSEEQYHQQRMMPCGNTSKRTMHPQQTQQQHLLHNVPMTHQVNKYLEQHTGMRQRAVPVTSVRPVAPFQYQQRMDHYTDMQKSSNPEFLHQELRMLHALHYQEKINKNEELLNAQWKQSLDVTRKLRAAHGSASDLMYETQRREQLLCQTETVCKKQVCPETQSAYRHQAPEMMYRQQEELYQSQRNRYAISPPLHPKQTDIPPYNPTHVDVHARMKIAAQQGVPHPVHENFVREHQKYVPAMQQIHRTEDYCNRGSIKQQRYSAPQQYHQTPAGVEYQQYLKPVTYTNQVPFQNPNAIRNRRILHEHSKASDISNNVGKAQLQQHLMSAPFHIDPDVMLVQEPVEQKPCTNTSNVGGQRQTQELSRDSQVLDKQTHQLSDTHPEGNMQQKREKVVVTDMDLGNPKGLRSDFESSRISKGAVSIKQEQLLLKEELELSLQRAAIQSMKKKIMKEEVKDSATHTVISNSSDTESMPRIVEVRSLATQESLSASPVARSITSKRNSLNSSPADVMGTDTKTAKSKSVMIKTQQDFQDILLNAHRVPSRGSLDSENGRKDSWDSGIESPPWAEGSRDIGIMNLKRTASLPSEPMGGVSSHKFKEECREYEKCSSTSGLDLSVNKRADAPVDLRRSHSLTEGCTNTANEMIIEHDVKPAHSSRIKHQSAETEQNTITREQLRLIPRKRSLQSEDLCLGQPKVPKEEPGVIDYSRPKNVEEPKETEQENLHQDHEEAGGNDAEYEVPLDLSIKKEIHTSVDATGEPDIDGADGETVPSADIQLQGYFGTIMMRALKRLWSTSKFKFEGEEAESSKPECVESSDEDSGKYFKPSSVTTLNSIPGLGNLDREQQQVDSDHKKTLLNSSSAESLENALCELMQQSSDAFKHGGDIFQHFDRMIKRELLIEIEKQPLKQNEASTSSEIKKGEAILNDNASELKDNFLEEQSSEAVALRSSSPASYVAEIEEMDDSQNLVIVESSMSPKVSPDSQEVERKVELDVSSQAEAPAVDEQYTSAAVDSSVSKTCTTLGEMYEKAARNAAQKAAREAAEKAAKTAAERAAMVAKVLMSPRDEGVRVGDVIEMEMIPIEEGLSPQPSFLPQKEPGAVDECALRSPGPNHKQLENTTTTSARYQQSQALNLHPVCSSDRGVPDLTESKGEDRILAKQPFGGRRFSEPVNMSLYCQNGRTSHEAPGQLQRVANAEASSSVTPVNDSRMSSDVRHHSGKPYRKIVPTTWQAHGIDVNKLKLTKVPCSNANQSHTPSPSSAMQNKLDTKRQFQRSPIVLLPKMVCIPGHTYPQPPPVSLVQSAATGNIVFIQQENRKNTASPGLGSTNQLSPTNSGQAPANNHAFGDNNQSPVLSNSVQSPDCIESVCGPFLIIKKTPEPPSPKKPCVSAFIIIYRDVSLPGVLRSGVPFVPPRMLQEGMFPGKNFDSFCHTLQDCSIMQRYMTVLERAALLPDLRSNKVSSCKLVSLEEFHNKYDKIKVLLQERGSDKVK